jgi:4-hydroxy-3-methylbut-2-enyl diphosphate reductase
MKIILAKTAGFCMGVRRAVEMVLDAYKTHPPPVYTFGPLIHNPQVLELLEEKGISILHHVPETGCGTVIVRAHGVPPDIIGRLQTAGFSVVDATCPRVIKVQNIIKKHAADGYSVIIVGDRNHPEVIGLHGHAGSNGYVAGSLEDVKRLPDFEKTIVVAQTTQNTRFYETVTSWIQETHPHYRVFNTICDSTEKRQAEVKEMAAQCDVLIVVGGKSSGNTQRLFEIAKQSGKPAYHIETGSELDPETLARAPTIGITAGASTPNWIIKRVCRNIEHLPYRVKATWFGSLLELQRTLLLTSLYLAAGAGCLGYACVKLQRLEATVSTALIAFFYILAMHILNNFSGKLAGRYNAPDKVEFYDQNRGLLVLLAVLSTVVGMALASVLGWKTLVVFLLMTLAGLLYNTDILPAGLSALTPVKLRDIPASKTLVTSFGWGGITAVFPALAASGGISASTVFVFFWSTGLVFVRTAFFDILDIQGDRIVGRETIPILIGERRTLKLLKSTLVILSMILAVMSFAGVASALGYWLIMLQASLYAVIRLHETGRILPGTRLEFVVETHFVASGVIALLWSMSG